MHPSPSPAPPPAICSSPVIGLQPPSPVNKLLVHLCYKQGYWNNQGLKRTAKRKQNPPKGRWLTSDGSERAKQGEGCQVPKSGWGKFLKTFLPMMENALCNYDFGDEFCNFTTDSNLLSAPPLKKKIPTVEHITYQQVFDQYQSRQSQNQWCQDKRLCVLSVIAENIQFPSHTIFPQYARNNECSPSTHTCKTFQRQFYSW